MDSSNSQDRIMIGEIVSAVGIKGEVKAKCYSSSPDRFSWLDFVFCENPDGDLEKLDIEEAGSKGDMSIIKFKRIKDRNEAEALRGAKLYIEESQLEELPEDTFYVRDLMGLKVINHETEEEVGSLSDVVQNTAQDIYIIKREGSTDVMVPAVKEFIKEIDLESGCVRIRFIEGML